MLMRLLPLIGGLLLTRGSRRMAGRHAGKLTLALGAWELWRAYQASKPAAPSQGPQTQGPQAGTANASARPTKTVRNRKRLI
jgi:hypothetical protein